MLSQPEIQLRLREFRENFDNLKFKTLPSFAYHLPEIFEMEKKKLFFSEWICVGRVEAFGATGDYIAKQVFGQNILITRDKNAKLHAFYNVCPHRGALLFDCNTQGSGIKHIKCPYHSWVFDLTGELKGCSHMNVPGFNKKEHNLYRIDIDCWGGFVFINFSDQHPTLEQSLHPFLEKYQSIIDRYELENLRKGHTQRYEVNANWKLIIENHNECYHCFCLHPEFNKISNYNSGEDNIHSSTAIGGWMGFDYPKNKSVTIDGQTKRSYFPKLTPEDHQKSHYFTILPNLLLTLFPDYVMTHTIYPTSAETTLVINDYYFSSEEIKKPDFDPMDACTIWDITNKQDWKISESVQVGIKANAHQHGLAGDYETLLPTFGAYILNKLSD